MKITIDRTKCEGYAKCIQASPKVFKLDAKMIAEVIDAQADTDEKILLSAKICPTKAISLEEEGTGKRFFRRSERDRRRKFLDLALSRIVEERNRPDSVRQHPGNSHQLTSQDI